MATTSDQNMTASGQDATDTPEIDVEFDSVTDAIAYGRHHAAKASEAIGSISRVMGPSGVSPNTVDHAKYALKQLASLREALSAASYGAIERAVNDHGASVKELAEAAGVSHTTVYRRLSEGPEATIGIPQEAYSAPVRHWEWNDLPFGEYRGGSSIMTSPRSRWTCIYGIPGAGKTNICRSLVFQAMIRTLPVTVVTTDRQSYEFTQTAPSGLPASIVSTTATAGADLQGILNAGTDPRTDDDGNTKPHLIVVDELSVFEKNETICTLLADLIVRAEELNLIIVASMSEKDGKQADYALHGRLREELGRRTTHWPGMITHIILPGTTSMADKGSSPRLRKIGTAKGHRSVMRFRADGEMHDLPVHPWFAEEDLLRRVLRELAGH